MNFDFIGAFGITLLFMVPRILNPHQSGHQSKSQSKLRHGNSEDNTQLESHLLRSVVLLQLTSIITSCIRRASFELAGKIG